MEEHVPTPVEMIGDGHFLSFECSTSVGVIIEQALGFGEINAIEHHEVALSGHPVAMRRFVLAHEQEGLVFVFSIFEPFDGFICDDIGDVAFNALLGSVHLDEIWIPIVALRGEDFPVIEADRLGNEVPFSDDRGIISSGAEEFIEGGLRAVEA